MANSINKETLLKGFELMSTSVAMAELYEENKAITSKYVHATARGHEAMQLPLGMQLKNYDYVSPYYRDDAILLGMGLEPHQIMMQLFAKKDDVFSGGRTYYGHPSLRDDNFAKIIHQSSATGMQMIPTTGIGQGIQYLESQKLNNQEELPIAVCSIGDGALTEGEISEAFQMAVLHKYPILYFVQDNEWDISAKAEEIRAMDAPDYAKGFKGLKVFKTEGNNFEKAYLDLEKAIDHVRNRKGPALFYGKVPLLSHHTSGVRKEWYRNDLEEDQNNDPYPILWKKMLENGFSEEELIKIREEKLNVILDAMNTCMDSEDPAPSSLMDNIFAPSPITEEQGQRAPENGEPCVMVDSALHAVDDILQKHPEALLYGQDVGGELGGVFREAALLAKKYGDKRVFNTPIQEAYIIGSTNGMSAVGCKPIVEVQFADYVWPGLNQLFSELSRSCYLSNGKWPVQSLIRVPIGAYGSGGPYHSSSIESVLLQIKGIKVVYPSNSADMKGLMKGAFYDPNPVVILEHKGLYWSKVPGTNAAKEIEPDNEYILPLGKARITKEASFENIENGESALIITYGMGVHWSLNAAKELNNNVEIIDLRSLNPIDHELLNERIKVHNKCLLVTEETISHSFMQALANKLTVENFENLDAPIQVIGSKDVPAIPLNENLEKAVLPNAALVLEKLQDLLNN